MNHPRESLQDQTLPVAGQVIPKLIERQRRVAAELPVAARARGGAVGLFRWDIRFLLETAMLAGANQPASIIP